MTDLATPEILWDAHIVFAGWEALVQVEKITRTLRVKSVQLSV